MAETKIVIGAEGVEILPLTAAELAQRELDAQSATAMQEAEDAEMLRIATYADDPEVTDGLTAIGESSAPAVDTYVNSVITLTATDIDTLREEVQTALRAILRRQLKVQFDPKSLLAQLNNAKTEVARRSLKQPAASVRKVVAEPVSVSRKKPRKVARKKR